MIRFFLSLALISASACAEINVYFSPSKDVPEAIERALNSATQSIDLAIYSFTDTRTQKKLREAAERNVRVRVILHDAKRKESLANKLEDAGADVRHVSKVMHHKFVIVDGVVLLSGSSNWSRSAYSRYDEDLLEFRDEPQIQAFQREFNYIWDNAKEFGDSKGLKNNGVSNDNDCDVVFTSANLEPYLYRGSMTFRTKAELADGVCGKRLITAIKAARDSIDIASAHYRRFDLHNELLKAIDRGVKVRLLLDQQERHADSTETPNALFDEALSKAGAEVRYKVYSRFWDFRTALQMHCKYMVVDQREVLTGSLNWSENAELQTLENLVVLRDRSIAETYTTRFELKWNYGREDDLKSLKAKLEKSNGRYPCSFSPITLTFEEAGELYRLYAKRACISPR